MKISLRGAAVALACATASVAGAQGTKPSPADTGAAACDPGSGPAVAKAILFLQRAAQGTQAKQDVSMALRQAIGVLTTPGKDNADSVGRAYYLGQAYILLLQQPGITPVGARSSYGIATEPTATVDLFAAADSAFTTVETAMPACRPELSQWREQKPWLDAMNAAIAAVNAQQFDSAAAYANRALTIDKRAPYAYTVLASVATNKKDYATATSMLQKAIDAAGADTLYADAKENAMFDLANTYNMQFDAAAGAEKSAAAQKAVAAWKEYISAGNNSARVAHALMSAGQILEAQKDTAALAQLYAPVLANPSKYGEQVLLNSGVLATRAQKKNDATTFFAAALALNPNQRDALKNLAASYIGANQPDKVIPLVDKLVTLDPNNADNWLLYAYAYSGMLKNTKDPKLTKTYTDSLVKYNDKSEKLNPVLNITEFSMSGADKHAELGGTIENRGTAAKSYTISVDFLDKSGAVVGTQSTTVGPVQPKASVPFKVPFDGDGVVAYRYKPIS
jgi:tetratricopeptide (TPR) repeat protein